MALDATDINLLELEHILDINEMIRKISKEEKEIQYTGEKTYSIDIKKINALLENVPLDNIINISVYYLKNIILLQPFPDGNHRTALASVEFFLNKNGYGLSYDADDALEFQKKAYSVRLETYGNYDQHDVSILAKPNDDFSTLCRDFIEKSLTKSN
jgi:prophage maintenance system killer protein